MSYPIAPENVKFSTRKALRDDPTMEEIEALIAEQMKRLPRWWNNCYGGQS
jgi:hypothetical protein